MSNSLPLSLSLSCWPQSRNLFGFQILIFLCCRCWCLKGGSMLVSATTVSHVLHQNCQSRMAEERDLILSQTFLFLILLVSFGSFQSRWFCRHNKQCNQKERVQWKRVHVGCDTLFLQLNHCFQSVVWFHCTNWVLFLFLLLLLFVRLLTRDRL